MYIYQCKGCPYLNPREFKCMYTGWPVEEVDADDCYMEEREDIPLKCHKCVNIDLRSLTCNMADNKRVEDVTESECKFKEVRHEN